MLVRIVVHLGVLDEWLVLMVRIVMLLFIGMGLLFLHWYAAFSSLVGGFLQRRYV